MARQGGAPVVGIVPIAAINQWWTVLGEGKIIVTGAAGLVGQNLILRLRNRGYADIVAIDKHPANTAILRRLHPDIEVIQADLSTDDTWQGAVQGARTVIVNHAQIGGLNEAAFIANNITATERLLSALDRQDPPHLVHISSSVVNSRAVDWYTESKKAQEKLIVESGFDVVVLRPTLMFGWFDRKHLGWLSRFMGRVPVFPIPGHGRYPRQPLYVGDLCQIVVSCIESRISGETFSISGVQWVDYVDMIRAVRAANRLSTPIVRIPYWLFLALLQIYAAFDRDPPFTTNQLAALVVADEFEVIDWPSIFGVEPTSLAKAFEETFQHPEYSRIILEF